MNNDLISRDALKKAIKNSFKHNLHGYDALLISEVDEFIDNAPTVEYPFYAEAYQTGYEEGKNERPTGEWINEYWEDAYQEYYHTCDVCKTEIVKTAYDNYCSCCGAKMRKGEK